MASHQVTESEIIDVVLGQAAPEVEAEVRRAVRSDAEFAAVYDQWTQVIPAMKQENIRAKAVTRKACERVMERLREEREHEPARALSRKSWGTPGWRWALAAAACLVVCAGFLTTLVYRSHESPMVNVLRPTGQDAPQVGQQAMAYVEFSHNRPNGLGTASQPFKTLAEGIAAVPVGGTVRIKGDVGDPSTPETPRITKAMRIEALGGTVTIGRPLCSL